MGGILHRVSASPPACGEVVVAKGACMDSYPADHNVWQQIAGPRDKSSGDAKDGVVAERQAAEGGVAASRQATEGGGMANRQATEGGVAASQQDTRQAAGLDGDAGEGQCGVPPSQAAPSPKKHRVPTLAPQEVLLDAACAFDSLARYVTASNFDQLSKTQADAVMRIALFGPASMTELASGLGVSKEHVTRAVAGLEEQGLVTKRRNAENRRIVEAVLTEKGEEAVTAIRLASIERLEKPLSSLSPAERDELVDLSTKAVSLLLRIRLG